MVNPTGYTALDLIGFTDKGTYANNANYVRNDLVHYSGSIWRCLVDDTTGIAPAEGVNWTIFINQPSGGGNVEQMIAPIEQATASEPIAIGDQFIYDDVLYEATAAIAQGGDIIIPPNAGANCKVSDTLVKTIRTVKENAYLIDDATETSLASNDILPFYDTSASAKKKMTVQQFGEQLVSNRNLLDNPWFTVNQRGQSVYSSTNLIYTLDRWKLRSDDATKGISVSTDGVTLDSGATMTLYQLINEEMYSYLRGKNITFSILLSDGTIKSATAVFPDNDPSTTQVLLNIQITGQWYLRIIYVPGSNNPWHYEIHNWGVAAPTSLSVRATKLEIGEVSTLAMDTAPNYPEELLKCQRYFIRLSGGTNGVNFAFGKAHDATVARAIINFPTKMRKTPTLGYSNVGDAFFTTWGTNERVYATALAINGAYDRTDAVTLDFTSTGMTADETMFFGVKASGYIDFSADL